MEKQVAKILLGLGEQLEIDGRTYTVAPPTPATLIMVSAMVTDLPNITQEGNLAHILMTAKDCEVIGRIIATIILGAKRVKECHLVDVPKKYISKKWSWRKFRKIPTETQETARVCELDYLADKILSELSPRVTGQFLAKLLGQMQLADFFAITASLKGITITKPTKEAVATHLGQ